MTSPIGRSVRRLDGIAKVTGEAVFGIDYEEPRLLHGRILRSRVPSGRIVRLDTAQAAAMPGVRAVITAADAPGRTGWVVMDQTLLADGVVRFVGEAVAAVAADTIAQAAAAVRAIELEIEPLPALTELRAAAEPGSPPVHPGWESYATIMPGRREGNLVWEGSVDRGDVDAAFARGDVTVVEGEYEVLRQNQAYIEPRCAVASWAGGRCTVHSSTQGSFRARDAVALFCGVRQSQVRVVQPVVGGGFGGKVDFHLEPFAALLARKAGRPVKLVNTRRDEFLTGSPRENAVVRLRSAVTRDGDVVGRDAVILLDAGAYSSETPFLCSVGALTVASNYRVEALRVRTRAYYTNTAPTGAYRGVSGTHMIFALEPHMDEIAAAIGSDRRALRLRNVFVDGDATPTGQVLDDVAFLEGFAHVERLAPWAAPAQASGSGGGSSGGGGGSSGGGDDGSGSGGSGRGSAARPGRARLHGKGLGIVSWLTNPMPASVVLKLDDDGCVVLHAAGGESGSGSMYTGVAQIIAAELGIAVEDVVVAPPDTDAAGYDAGAQGSRTTHIVGKAAAIAAGDVRDQVLAVAAGMLEAAPGDLELAEGTVRVAGSPGQAVALGLVAQTATWTVGPIQGRGSYIAPPIPYDAGCSVGNALATLNGCSFHVHLAEVEVDPDTGKVEITRYVVAQDVGKAINPVQIEGQIHGGVLQGVGYALYEGQRLQDGSPLDLDLESYRLPTALDAPPLEYVLMEHPDANGPFGAKGIAEPPILPVAAAIANAVSAAVGKPFNRLPITPFDVLAALRER